MFKRFDPLKKVSYALDGLGFAWQTQSSFRAILSIDVVVIVLGFLYGLTSYEWVTILVPAVVTLVCEVFNTALEHLCDIFSRGWILSEVGVVKDLSAGAVLLALVINLVVDCVVFYNRFVSP